MKAIWDQCLRDKTPVPPAVAEWMNEEHDRILNLVAKREIELARANEDKKILAAKIDKLVEELNIERAARDDSTGEYTALKKEMDDLSRAMNLEKTNFGCLRWESFFRDKARAEKYINDLTGVRSVEVFYYSSISIRCCYITKFFTGF